MAETFNSYTGLLLGAEEIHLLTEKTYGIPWPQALIEDYTSIATSLEALSNAITDSLMLLGSGSPEGAVAANQSRQYFDTTGNILYINATVGADTGWIAIN